MGHKRKISATITKALNIEGDSISGQENESVNAEIAKKSVSEGGEASIFDPPVVSTDDSDPIEQLTDNLGGTEVLQAVDSVDGKFGFDICEGNEAVAGGGCSEEEHGVEASQTIAVSHSVSNNQENIGRHTIKISNCKRFTIRFRKN